MPYGDSEIATERSRAPVAIKILIAGGFGAGKTTLVGAVSEVRPLRTEETLSEPSTRIDPLDGARGKTTTTVAMDFGRISISDDLVVYLFGTPGLKRFWFDVGRAGLRRARRGRDRRHQAARRLLPFCRLLRASGHAVRRGRELLRRRPSLPARHHACGAQPHPRCPARALRCPSARVKPGRAGRAG